MKVTARSVDGDVPSAGFGLMVHCVQTKAKKLEDYALLIYPGDEPEYEIIMHKDGDPVVGRAKDQVRRDPFRQRSKPVGNSNPRH